MALANCDECGKELSEHAEACPHCAAPAKIALCNFREDQERLERERLEVNRLYKEQLERERLEQERLERERLERERPERERRERLEQERRKKVIIGHVALEGVIRKTLSKPEGDLTKGDLEQLTELYLNLKDLDGNQFTDLTPLKDLTQLTRLDLIDNQITDLTPLKNLTQLTTLNLIDNQITDLMPLKDLTQLRELDIEGNPTYDDNTYISDSLGNIPITILKRLKMKREENKAGSPWWKFW